MDKHFDTLSGGIFLIGLGILFLVPGLGFFPWILVVIGLAGLPASIARKSGWYGYQGFFWLTGLAILFATGYFWPGILIMAGLSMLLGAGTSQSAGSPLAKDRNVQTIEVVDAQPFGVDASDDQVTPAESQAPKE